MKLLAVDTSGPVCGVAILTEDGIRHECAVMNHKTHSVNLLPMIDNAFQSTGLTIQDMDRLAVVVGPGSFTGVRLGVSTVKGLAHGAGKPCVAVNALEAMAAGISGFSGVVCPIQDARAGQVYGAAFSAGENRPNRLMADTPMKVEDYVAEISRFRRPLPIPRRRYVCASAEAANPAGGCCHVRAAASGVPAPGVGGVPCVAGDGNG